MPAKTPDSISMRYVEGSHCKFYLTFSSTTLDNGDTVDVSPYVSTVLHAWFTPTTAQTVARTISGTTVTHVAGGNGLAGVMVVEGNP